MYGRCWILPETVLTTHFAVHARVGASDIAYCDRPKLKKQRGKPPQLRADDGKGPVGRLAEMLSGANSGESPL